MGWDGLSWTGTFEHSARLQRRGQEPVPRKALNYCTAELAPDRHDHPARGANANMDLSDASTELLAETYTDLVRLQDDLVTLQSEADVDEDTDPVVGDISKLITQIKDKVQERGLNEQELRDQARR